MFVMSFKRFRASAKKHQALFYRYVGCFLMEQNKNLTSSKSFLFYTKDGYGSAMTIHVVLSSRYVGLCTVSHKWYQFLIIYLFILFININASLKTIYTCSRTFEHVQKTFIQVPLKTCTWDHTWKHLRKYDRKLVYKFRKHLYKYD